MAKLRISNVYAIIVIFVVVAVVLFVAKSHIENYLLKKVIERLTADTRVAEVMVSDVSYDAKNNKTYTTIKFLEYDARLNPLEPKYFTFSGNIIQFQSMVIRFDDFLIKIGHPLKGKSAYLFMKAFMLTNQGAETFEITKMHEIPSGYEIDGVHNSFERKLWQKFWEYALDSKKANKLGIKNVQIEAPGTKFIPGLIYTLTIEHDGGLRIDAKPVNPILRNETLRF